MHRAGIWSFPHRAHAPSALTREGTSQALCRELRSKGRDPPSSKSCLVSKTNQACAPNPTFPPSSAGNCLKTLPMQLYHVQKGAKEDLKHCNPPGLPSLQHWQKDFACYKSCGGCIANSWLLYWIPATPGVVGRVVTRGWLSALHQAQENSS